MQKYNVIILAGGRAPWLQAVAGTDVRCLARLQKRRIIDYLVDALRSSGRVEKILVAAPSGVETQWPEGVDYCEADADLPSTASRAVAALGEDGKILVVCDDIPLLQGEDVEDFLQQCETNPGASLYYPIISREDCQKRYPEGQRTYARIKEGVFTGGNMMLIDGSVIAQVEQKAREIFMRRKNPLALCKWLGFGFIIKFLLHCLTKAELEERVSYLLEFPCKGIISSYPAIGMDIDKMADWQLAEKYLSGAEQQRMRKEGEHGKS